MVLILIRADVRGRGLGGNIVLMFYIVKGVVTEVGGMSPAPRGTLTPLIPLSLRAFKGEGEIRIEAHVRAEHTRGPLIQYWGEGDGFRLGGRNDGGGGG